MEHDKCAWQKEKMYADCIDNLYLYLLAYKYEKYAEFKTACVR